MIYSIESIKYIAQGKDDFLRFLKHWCKKNYIITLTYENGEIKIHFK
jgi:hypothetical protein